jgi:hypothetical protein
VCVIEMCDVTETRKRYKKVCEEGDKNAPLFFGCFETRSPLQKKIKRTQKEKEEIRISKYEST